MGARLFIRKNGGLSSARNAGMDVAADNFFMFVDSDNFIEKIMVAALLQSQNQTGADVVCYEINRYLQETCFPIKIEFI